MHGRGNRTNAQSLIGAWSGHCDPLKIFWSSNHITETAEPKVHKFCTRVCYINSGNRVTYHQQKGRGCGRVNCFNILPFVVMQSSSRGFVSDS